MVKEPDSQQIPESWTIDHLGSSSGSFRNDRYELSLKITPSYRSSSSRRPGKGENPAQFQVGIVQDWFSKGVYGEHELDVKVETWQEAVETAMEFMRNFNEDRRGISTEKVEEAHRSGENTETAESVLTAEATTEALADTISYSDDLLLDVLKAETNNRFRAVAHRYGEEVEYVVGSSDNSLEEVPLKRIYGAFPVDKSGVASLLADDTILTVSITLSGFRVYRFIFDDWRETNVVLEAETQVADSVFEQNVKNILRPKWESSS